MINSKLVCNKQIQQHILFTINPFWTHSVYFGPLFELLKGRKTAILCYNSCTSYNNL